MVSDGFQCRLGMAICVSITEHYLLNIREIVREIFYSDFRQSVGVWHLRLFQQLVLQRVPRPQLVLYLPTSKD